VSHDNKTLRDYVFKYFQKNRKRSATTLFNYANDYKLFFKFLSDNIWVLDQLNVSSISPGDIPISILAELPLEEIEEFQGSFFTKLNKAKITMNIKII